MDGSALWDMIHAGCRLWHYEICKDFQSTSKMHVQVLQNLTVCGVTYAEAGIGID